MTVVVESNATLADALRDALRPGVTVLESPELLEDHLQRHPEEYAVVLGPTVGNEAATALAEHNRIHRPTLGVILMRPDLDSQVLGEALRSGMREVVETADLRGLLEAVHRAYGLAQAMFDNVEHAAGAAAPRKGSLITVFSTKGGVGKSLVATNLAASMADSGERVCLVDLDVQCGDVAIMLQLTPVHTLADLARIAGAIDASGVESLITEHSPGLSVLAAPVQLGSHVPAEAIEAVLEILKGLFTMVVVDTSGSFDDFALPALDRSELVVLVGTLDIPSLKSLKLATGTLDLLGFPRDRWRLLLNRADSKVGLSASEFSETLSVEASASLPSSRDVLAAVNRGETIVRANPAHPVSKILATFADALVRELVPAHPPEDAETPGAPKRRGAARRSIRLRRVG